jgi:hypothetical protein
VISAEEFVRVWQTAESIAAVSESAGVSAKSCYARAWHFRKLGVPLKKFRPVIRNSIDITKLKALAESLQK